MIKVLLFLLISLPLTSQSFDGLYRAKVKTLDSTIETLYSVISGDKGVARNWDLFKYLFTENAKLVPVRQDNDGRLSPMYLSAEDYVSRSGAYLVNNGFFEKEIYRIKEEYGGLTHIFSTYESYRTSQDKEPFARGINSIQLLNDGSRWWIINMSWQAETDKNPLPAKYLGK